MKHVHFNANWDPEYYYPYLKLLALLCDDISVWGINETDFEQYDGDFSGFFRFLEKQKSLGESVIIPAGRPEYFQSHVIRSGDTVLGQNSQAYLKIAREIAENNNAIVSVNRKEATVLNTKKLAEQNPLAAEKIAKTISPHFCKTFRDHLLYVGDVYGMSESAAYLNAVFQDFDAMRALNVESPFTMPELANGYLAFELHLNPDEQVQSKDDIGTPVENLSNKKLKEFFDAILPSLSWDDVAELRFDREDFVPNIRRFIHQFTKEKQDQCSLIDFAKERQDELLNKPIYARALIALSAVLAALAAVYKINPAVPDEGDVVDVIIAVFGGGFAGAFGMHKFFEIFEATGIDLRVFEISSRIDVSLRRRFGGKDSFLLESPIQLIGR